MIDPKDRITWKEACEILGCGKTFLYTLVYEGKIPAYGLGRRNRFFLRSECEKLLKESENTDFSKK